MIHVEWLDFPLRASDGPTDAEWTGLDFLTDADTQAAWRSFWPQGAGIQNWDAVARLQIAERPEWLLVEAKAHCGEIRIELWRQTRRRPESDSFCAGRNEGCSRRRTRTRLASWLLSVLQPAGRSALPWVARCRRASADNLLHRRRQRRPSVPEGRAGWLAAIAAQDWRVHCRKATRLRRGSTRSSLSTFADLVFGFAPHQPFDPDPPDPKVTGEGVLDPLGLSTIADRLARPVLPGLRARMSRPRFLTAMAVCAAVCDGIEDHVAEDGVTQSHVVFEWLLVEGFVRSAKREDTIRTPGMHKAQAAKDSGEPMRAAAYLRVPTIFGFHGIYRPLARQTGIVDRDMRLADHGYGLVKEWQSEQNLTGLLPTSVGGGEGTSARALLRSALEDALKRGYPDRSTQWRGWSVIAETLVPARVGAREAAFIHRLLIDGRAEPRGESFTLFAPRTLLTR